MHTIITESIPAEKQHKFKVHFLKRTFRMFSFDPPEKSLSSDVSRGIKGLTGLLKETDLRKTHINLTQYLNNCGLHNL